MGCQIVLIDDDPGFAEVLAEVLETEHHVVYRFATPDAALEWLLSGAKADVVLLDLHTPGMSPRLFKEVLKSVIPLKDLPIIMVSGDPELPSEAAAMGIDDAFSKPLDMMRFLSTVDRYDRLN